MKPDLVRACVCVYIFRLLLFFCSSHGRILNKKVEKTLIGPSDPSLICQKINKYTLHTENAKAVVLREEGSIRPAELRPQ